jgi:hypothetical protein
MNNSTEESNDSHFTVCKCCVSAVQEAETMQFKTCIELFGMDLITQTMKTNNLYIPKLFSNWAKAILYGLDVVEMLQYPLECIVEGDCSDYFQVVYFNPTTQQGEPIIKKVLNTKAMSLVSLDDLAIGLPNSKKHLVHRSNQSVN